MIYTNPNFIVVINTHIIKYVYYCCSLLGWWSRYKSKDNIRHQTGIYRIIFYWSQNWYHHYY